MIYSLKAFSSMCPFFTYCPLFTLLLPCAHLFSHTFSHTFSSICSDDRTIPFNHRHRVYSNGTLQIANLNKHTDTGKYTCTAYNGTQPLASSSFYLQVLSKYTHTYTYIIRHLLMCSYVLYFLVVFAPLSVRNLSLFLFLSLPLSHGLTLGYITTKDDHPSAPVEPFALHS